MEKDIEICNEFIIKTASDTKTVPLTNFRINKYIYICCILLLLQLHRRKSMANINHINAAVV